MRFRSASVFLASFASIFPASVYGQLSSSSTPIIFTAAGGSFGDGHLASSVGIGFVQGTAVDANGNIYFSDWNNHIVMTVDSSGTLKAVAGRGIPSGSVTEAGIDSIVVTASNGDGGPATVAELGNPSTLGFDNSGNLYILERENLDDSDGNRIRKVDTNGNISTFAGTGVSGFTGDGGKATQAEICLNNGEPLFHFDSAGNLYFSDCAGARIRKVDINGAITTIAGTGTPGFSGDGGPATAAEIDAGGLFVDGAGNLFFLNIATNGNQRDVRMRVGRDEP
jgi:hypothetical protein